MAEAWIIDAVRSPRGRSKPGGGLAHLHPQRILAQVLQGLHRKAGFDLADVEDVVAGCGSGNGEHAHDIGRLAVLDAGWPVTATGVTLHRFCGSGQQAVTFAAMGILSGHQDVVVACGIESMSKRAPMHSVGFHASNDHLFAQYPLVPQGISADLIASLDGWSREDCDRLAVQSQARAEVALKEGRFARSLVPIHNDDGSLALERDEHPRPGTTLESLAGLKPAFDQMGTTLQEGYAKTFDDICREVYPQVKTMRHVHHGGNSSGVVDGAGALLLTSADYARAHGLKPRARVRMTATAGAEPVIMLTAPGPAALRCLKKAGMQPGDIDLWEINEAFASVVLRFTRDVPVDTSKLNVNGGAIALGHPIGATGTMLIGTAIDELERTGKGTALIAMCTGGGMATATIIERI